MSYIDDGGYVVHQQVVISSSNSSTSSSSSHTSSSVQDPVPVLLLVSSTSSSTSSTLHSTSPCSTPLSPPSNTSISSTAELPPHQWNTHPVSHNMSTPRAGDIQHAPDIRSSAVRDLDTVVSRLRNESTDRVVVDLLERLSVAEARKNSLLRASPGSLHINSPGSQHNNSPGSRHTVNNSSSLSSVGECTPVRNGAGEEESIGGKSAVTRRCLTVHYDEGELSSPGVQYRTTPTNNTTTKQVTTIYRTFTLSLSDTICIKSLMFHL